MAYTEAAQAREKSPPSREAWIEIYHGWLLLTAAASPPAREAWIEIVRFARAVNPAPSPPAREAWIEIARSRRPADRSGVASREGGVD